MSKKQEKEKDSSISESSIEGAATSISPADVSVISDSSAVESEEARQKYRLQLIEEYNKSSEDNTRILDSEVTAADIESAEKEYADAYERLANYKCTISDASNSVRVATFLKTWNAQDARWFKNYWQGTIKFDEFITGWLGKNENAKDPEPLTIDIGALTYLYNIMGEPSGHGLASAVKMQSHDDEYNAIYNEIWEFYQDFAKEYKRLDALNSVVASRHQGWMMVYEDPETKQRDASAAQDASDAVSKDGE